MSINFRQSQNRSVPEIYPHRSREERLLLDNWNPAFEGSEQEFDRKPHYNHSSILPNPLVNLTDSYPSFNTMPDNNSRPCIILLESTNINFHITQQSSAFRFQIGLTHFRSVRQKVVSRGWRNENGILSVVGLQSICQFISDVNEMSNFMSYSQIGLGIRSGSTPKGS